MPWEHRSEQLMLCEGCDAAFHTFCLKPPLKRVPTSDWFCTRCKHQASKDAKIQKATAAVARAAKYILSQLRLRTSGFCYLLALFTGLRHYTQPERRRIRNKKVGEQVKGVIMGPEKVGNAPRRRNR